MLPASFTTFAAPGSSPKSKVSGEVVPISSIDAERATAEGWWYKPDYIINELNINSAIASPYHGEEIDLARR